MEMVITDVRMRERHDWHDDSCSRVYFNPVDESIWENLINRHDRPYQLYKALMPQVLAKLGMNEAQVQQVEYRWSKHAGCRMCPCSPGIILSRRLRGESHKVFDVWVDVVGEDHDPVDVEYVAETVMGLGVVNVDRAVR